MAARKKPEPAEGDKAPEAGPESTTKQGQNDGMTRVGGHWVAADEMTDDQKSQAKAEAAAAKKAAADK